ncbi:MAG: hypothetical protein ACRC6X_03775 [Culicoidibacterales bacterium]
MDTTTIVILWDEIFEKIIQRFNETTATFWEKALPLIFEKAILLPLKQSVISANTLLISLLDNPYTFIFWTGLVEQILNWMYLMLLVFIMCQFVIELIKKIANHIVNEDSPKTMSYPLKRFIILQCLHFIGVPLLKVIIENYASWLQTIHGLITQQQKFSAKIDFSLIQLGKENLLLECVGLILIMYLLIKLLIQFMQQGVFLLFYFIKCYAELFYQEQVINIFLPLKMLSMRIFIVYVFQRMLVIEALKVTDGFISGTKLLMIIALLFTAVELPKFFKKELKYD